MGLINMNKCFECRDGIYVPVSISLRTMLNNGQTVHIPNLSVLKCNVCSSLIIDKTSTTLIENTVSKLYPTYYAKIN